MDNALLFLASFWFELTYYMPFNFITLTQLNLPTSRFLSVRHGGNEPPWLCTTITWIYADRLKADPERRHKVKGRTSFAFSDVRRLIAEAGLDEDFDRVCPKRGKPTKNSLVAILLRMVA